MKDKEFEELKRKVKEEEQRRAAIERKQAYAKELRKGFGLQPYNGWCIKMKIKIIQDVDMASGNDGNGPRTSHHYESELDDKACELLFEGFAQAAKVYEAEIKELEEQGNAKD